MSPKQQREARNQREGQDYIVCRTANRRREGRRREEERRKRGRGSGERKKRREQREKKTGADFSLRPRLLRRQPPPRFPRGFCSYVSPRRQQVVVILALVLKQSSSLGFSCSCPQLPTMLLLTSTLCTAPRPGRNPAPPRNTRTTVTGILSCEQRCEVYGFLMSGEHSTRRCCGLCRAGTGHGAVATSRSGVE